MKLLNNNLEVISITRQNIFDADFVCACDNCGRPIVNIATVKDVNTKEVFNIGLDCKKTLIDKKLIDKMLLSEDFTAKYNVKEYKKDLAQVNKFLLYASQTEKYKLEFEGFEVKVVDKTKEVFEGTGIYGAFIDYFPTGYLQKIGLGEFTQQLFKNRN